MVYIEGLLMDKLTFIFYRVGITTNQLIIDVDSQFFKLKLGKTNKPLSYYRS